MNWSYINRFNVDQLRLAVERSEPFPHFSIDNFLVEEFANQVNDCFPDPDEVKKTGKSFRSVNEQGKTQITDASVFPPAIAKLNEVLACQEWLDLLSDVMGIPNLKADPELKGGGIHQTGPRGRLDVHVDFNYVKDLELHRRLNVLVYFNKGWKRDWGGNIELWDKYVKQCHHSFSPIFNRCVVFATSDISYHGVTKVATPRNVTRNSFAAYYYTREAPPEWTGVAHSTIFRARPDEVLRNGVLVPFEKFTRVCKSQIQRVKSLVR